MALDKRREEEEDRRHDEIMSTAIDFEELD